MFLEEKTREAVGYLHRRGVTGAAKGIFLEPGMGGFSNELGSLVVAPLWKIPYFPHPQDPGRRGHLLFGTLREQKVFVLEGRGMLFEGYFHRELAFPLRVLAALGLKRLIIVSAVLSLGGQWSDGDLCLVEDHIDLSGGSSLRGLSPPVTPASLDPTRAYSASLKELAVAAAGKRKVELKGGVAAYLPGPGGVTAAESRMLAGFGVDVVSFSLAAEVMTALQLGIDTVAIGIVAGKAAAGGRGPAPGALDEGTFWYLRDLLQFLP